MVYLIRKNSRNSTVCVSSFCRVYSSRKQLSHFHVYHLDIWRSTLNEKNWLLLSLLSSLRPDMTEILLKRTLNRKPSVNPSTSPKKL